MPELPGRELQRLGQIITTGGAQLVSSIARYRALNASNEYENAYLQLIRGIHEFNDSLDDNFETYEERWRSTSEQLYETISEDIKSEEAKQKFELKYYEVNDAQWNNLASVIEARSTERAIHDSAYRIDEYARLGDINGVDEQFQILADAGVMKIGDKSTETLRYAKHQETYKNMVWNMFEDIFKATDGETALAWLANPESRDTYIPLAKLDSDTLTSLINDAKQRVAIVRDRAERSLKDRQDAANEQIWKDYIAGKVTTFSQVVRDYDLDPDKHAYWKNLFDQAEKDKLAKKSDPAAELETYQILASDRSVDDRVNAIDALVVAGKLTPDDGLKYRNQAKTYIIPPEYNAIRDILDKSIPVLVEQSTPGKRPEIMATGSRAYEAFFTMVRERQPVERVRQAVVNMFSGSMSNMLKEGGPLTKPPEKLTNKEAFELEKALEPAKEGEPRQPLALEQRTEQQLRIRELEQKVFDAKVQDLGVRMVDSLYDEREDGWIFFDRPVPRKKSGAIDVEAFRAGGYRMYKAQMTRKLLGRIVELYVLQDGEWKYTGIWEWLRKVGGE